MPAICGDTIDDAAGGVERPRVKFRDIGHGSGLSAVIQQATRSAIMMVGRLVLAEGMVGMMDA
jgi:hypothetical protein